jgi:micrococcal nuclease
LRRIATYLVIAAVVLVVVGRVMAGGSASGSPAAEATERPAGRATQAASVRPPGPSSRVATPQATPEPVVGLGPTGPVQVATVASVTDGDTIRVLLDGQNVPVRYIGIDTPETQGDVEWMGAEASEANASLVAGREVILEKDVSETDRFGRLLRHVWVETDDGLVLVSLELLRLGMAQVTTFPPDIKYIDELFLPAQRAAREAEVGLWATPPAAVATPAPIVPLVPGSSCEPSYPDLCIPVGSADLDCGDIDARRFTVLWDVPNPDPHRFDADGDGIGCES